MFKPLGKIGEKIETVKIQPFKADEKFPSVIAVISSEKGIFGTNVHYVDGMGRFQCFDGICCQRHGFADTRYVLPVIEYSLKDHTKFILDWPLYLRYLILGETAYNELIEKSVLNNGIHRRDMVVRCTNPKYKTLSFEMIPDKAPFWTTTDVMKGFVANEFKRYMTHIEQSVARPVTAEQYEQEYTMAMAKAASEAGAGRAIGFNPGASAASVTLPVYRAEAESEEINLADLMCEFGPTTTAAESGKDAVPGASAGNASGDDSLAALLS